MTDIPDPPTTDNLELPLLSEAEDPEDYRDIWGAALDELLIARLDQLLGEGEGDLNVESLRSALVETDAIAATNGAIAADDAVRGLTADSVPTEADIPAEGWWLIEETDEIVYKLPDE